MDLALENRIDTDAQRLFLIDSPPVGDRLLDPILAEIAQAGEPHDALYWVEHAPPGMPTRFAKPRWSGWSRPASCSAAMSASWGYSGRSVTRSWTEEVERELERRIRMVLLSDVIPDPREIVIVILADGCGLIEPLLSSDERAQATPRIALVAGWP